MLQITLGSPRIRVLLCQFAATFNSMEKVDRVHSAFVYVVRRVIASLRVTQTQQHSSRPAYVQTDFHHAEWTLYAYAWITYAARLY
jgi:hypothetical protein